jgi:hypothetical protein
MILILLNHQWKSFWRSSSAGKGLAIQIFIGLIVLYLLSTAVILGWQMKSLIEKISPGRDPVMIFAGFISYYFVIDIIARFMFQDLPTLIVKPYLIRNIRRSELIRFLNIRSVFNFFNLLPLLLFFPFIIMAIGPRFGFLSMFGFLTTIGLLVAASHFLILYIKRKTELNSWWLAGFFIFFTAVAIMDYFKWVSLSHISTYIFSAFLIHPWLCIFPFILAYIAYKNNDRYLLKNLYLEEMEGQQKMRGVAGYSFLNRYGIVGELISLDIKLIWRNRRPKTMVLYSLIFLFYGIVVFTPANLHKSSQFFMLVFGGLFMTGMTLYNYGSFLFSWQSGFFDRLMTINLPIQTYLNAKRVLLTGMSSLLLLASIVYGLMDLKLIFILLACYLYNTGVNVFLLLYLATWNFKGMDISRASTMNYQGTGIVQWLFVLSLIIFPLGIYFVINRLIGNWAGVLTLGILGIISLLLQDWWSQWLTKEFNKRKYLVLQGFREK